MSRIAETVDQSDARIAARDDGPPTPGIIRVYATDTPVFEARAITGKIVIGRGAECDLVIDDERASRRHAQVAIDGREWTVEDLGSRNGTFVDAVRLTTPGRLDGEAVLAIGNTVFLLVPDLRPLGGGVDVREGVVLGPRLRAVWDTIARLAPKSDTLHLPGETGSGKELAARHYHASRCPTGPFVAVNCAAVPELLAERLFFGARKGAYTGANVDSDGYLLAAEGGVLFLDEIGELSPEVQPKLLRAIETHEVLPLGAARPRRLNVSICTATHVDLRTSVSQGRFRDDLYFRIVDPAVELPPLRARREEIPWLIDATLRAAGPVRAHASFVEAAMARAWPGNVRELLRAVATAAKLVGDADLQLKMLHLPEHAGTLLAQPITIDSPLDSAPVDPEVARVVEALRAERGNVTRAARALGLHRTQLRRVLERHEIDPRRFKPDLLVDDDPD